MRPINKAFIKELHLGSESGADTTVKIKEKDTSGKITRATCTTVPSTTAGYAVGCILIRTSTGHIYVNTGSTTSCTFDDVGAIASSEIDANAITPIKMGTRTAVALSDADATPTIAQLMTSSVFVITPTVARLFTTPTAALMVAGISGCTIGTWFDFTIINLADLDVTLTAGSNVTLSGQAAVGKGSATFRAVVTAIAGDGAITIYRMNATLLNTAQTIAGVKSFTSPIVYDHNTTITAFSTGGQASATALTGEFNNITTVAADYDSVKLLPAVLGQSQTVKNSGTNILSVFPNTDDSINALAANLSVDIPVGGEMTFRSISATVYETNEVLISQAPSTQKGSLVVKAADSAGNTTTTITNASQTAARIYTVPDAGADANFMMAKGSQTVDGVNSFTAPVVYDHNTTITAFSTGGQASATALTGEYNNITTVAADYDSVKLLAAVLGQAQTVKNSGTNILSVFPNTDDSINALAANLSVDIPVGGEMTFRAISATVYETNEVLVSQAPSTQKGSLSLKAADNAANHAVVITNASHGQATVHTHPDGGAATDYVVHSTAALTLVEADYLDTASSANSAASKAVIMDASNQIRTVADIGTPATGVAAVETGSGIHKTVLTLTLTGDNDIDVADGADKTKGTKLYDFPAGYIRVLGATCDLSNTTNAAYNANVADQYFIGIGTADGTQAANADLTGTEQDIIAKTTHDTDSGAGANTQLTNTLKAVMAADAAFDGTSTAVALWLNIATPDANTSGPTTHAVTGTVTVIWANLGDY
jgi:hypothetical protein